MTKTAKVLQGTREAAVNMKAAGTKVSTIARGFWGSHIRPSHQSFNATRLGILFFKLRRKGRPRCTTAGQDRRIIRRSKADPNLSAVDIAAEFRVSDGKISRQTIGRRLNAAELEGRSPARKPLINSKNRRARVEFARSHLHWTSAEWSKVLFTDESKFIPFGSNGTVYAKFEAELSWKPWSDGHHGSLINDVIAPEAVPLWLSEECRHPLTMKALPGQEK
ncbi:transposase, partial [Ostertagia ostertagi]